jgi:hypothetical protein
MDAMNKLTKLTAVFAALVAAGCGGSGFGGAKTVQIPDPMFGMVADTLQVPSAWNFEGTVLHGPGCGADYVGTAFRAYSKDMRYGVQVIPAQSFYWADDPKAIPQGQNCKRLQPMGAGDYGTLIAPSMRPGAVVDSVEDSPTAQKFLDAIEQNNQALARQCQQMRMPQCAHVQGEVKRVHIHYLLDGKPEEEWLTVAMAIMDQPVSVNTAPLGKLMHLEMKDEITTTVYVTGARAPQGELAGLQGAFETISKSFQTNPDYNAKFAAYMQAKTNRQIEASWRVVHSMMAQSDATFRQHIAQGQAFLQNMQAQGDARREQFNAQMAAKSGHAQDVADYLLDQQYFVNPTTGQTTTQSDAYNHTFSNGGNGIVQTNDPTFSPQGVLQGNWTALQPIHH